MRGDRPAVDAYILAGGLFTPHARGSTFDLEDPYNHEKVYPACAGIDPGRGAVRELTRRLPRMRGDRPYFLALSAVLLSFTPHARGSTFVIAHIVRAFRVYPACAGIDRQRSL